MELLKAVLIVTKCKNTEELRNLSPERKMHLAQSLEERVPSGLAPIEEWNELLTTFMGAQPESENKTAKKKLLCFLRNEEYKNEVDTPDKDKWWQFEKNNRK